MRILLMIGFLLSMVGNGCVGQKLNDPHYLSAIRSAVKASNFDKSNRYVIAVREQSYVIVVENRQEQRYDIYTNLPDCKKNKKVDAPYPDFRYNRLLNAADMNKKAKYEKVELTEKRRFYIRSCNPKTGKYIDWTSQLEVPNLNIFANDGLAIFSHTNIILMEKDRIPPDNKVMQLPKKKPYDPDELTKTVK